MAKYIFITGGVVSGLGKGIAAASLGRLLKARGLKVALQKFDPYLNIDPGTMNPYQHGEVFVTEDGAETDLDLGHYERFTDEDLTVDSSITSGKVYWSVLSQEREGAFLGGTVQVIPHITGEIKERIYRVGRREEVDVVITEIGGTVGDIESQPFLEAIRQVAAEVGRQNVLYLHVSLIVSIPGTGEPKSKPTQHSVKELLGLGIQPDVILCRCDGPVSQKVRDKIALFCNVPPERVISNETAPILYEVPLMLEEAGLAKAVCEVLGLPFSKPHLEEWRAMVERAKRPAGRLEIALVGKYVALHGSFLERRIKDKLEQDRRSLEDKRQRLELYMWDGLKAGRHRLALDAGRLDALSPLKKLSGGYGFVTDSRGNAVRSIGQTGTGDRIGISVRDGRIEAQVTGTVAVRLPESEE